MFPRSAILNFPLKCCWSWSEVESLMCIFSAESQRQSKRQRTKNKGVWKYIKCTYTFMKSESQILIPNTTTTNNDNNNNDDNDNNNNNNIMLKLIVKLLLIIIIIIRRRYIL